MAQAAQLSALCDLEGGRQWGGERGGLSGVGGWGIYEHIQLIHFAVWQKLTKHWKAIIFHK